MVQRCRCGIGGKRGHVIAHGAVLPLRRQTGGGWWSFMVQCCRRGIGDKRGEVIAHGAALLQCN